MSLIDSTSDTSCIIYIVNSTLTVIKFRLLLLIYFGVTFRYYLLVLEFPFLLGSNILMTTKCQTKTSLLFPSTMYNSFLVLIWKKFIHFVHPLFTGIFTLPYLVPYVLLIWHPFYSLSRLSYALRNFLHSPLLKIPCPVITSEVRILTFYHCWPQQCVLCKHLLCVHLCIV